MVVWLFVWADGQPFLPFVLVQTTHYKMRVFICAVAQGIFGFETPERNAATASLLRRNKTAGHQAQTCAHHEAQIINQRSRRLRSTRAAAPALFAYAEATENKRYFLQWVQN